MLVSEIEIVVNLTPQNLKSQTDKNVLFSNVRFISYLMCFNCRRISKLMSNFECLFTFCYSDGANSIKTDLNTCNLWTGQFVSYKFVIFFCNLDEANSIKTDLHICNFMDRPFCKLQVCNLAFNKSAPAE